MTDDGKRPEGPAGRAEAGRSALMRKLHAIAGQYGESHEDLRAAARKRYGVESLREVTTAQLSAWLDEIQPRRTAHPGYRTAAQRRQAGVEGTKRDDGKVVSLASGDDVAMVFALGYRAGMTRPEVLRFIERQLGKGRSMKTLGQVNKVMGGLRAIKGRGKS